MDTDTYVSQGKWFMSQNHNPQLQIAFQETSQKSLMVYGELGFPILILFPQYPSSGSNGRENVHPLAVKSVWMLSYP